MVGFRSKKRFEEVRKAGLRISLYRHIITLAITDRMMRCTEATITQPKLQLHNRSSQSSTEHASVRYERMTRQSRVPVEGFVEWIDCVHHRGGEAILDLDVPHNAAR